MKKHFIFYAIVLMVIILFIGCSSPLLPEPTLEPTSTVTAEPTETPIPFCLINLEQLLIQPGDLPIGYSAGQLREQPEMFDNFIKDIGPADYSVFQQFAKNGKANGGVTVFVYEDTNTTEMAYNALDTYKNIKSSDGIEVTTGTFDQFDRSSYIQTETNILNIKSSHIEMIFSKCHAVVHIRLTNSEDLDGLESYAKRLQDRLEKTVCR